MTRITDRPIYSQTFNSLPDLLLSSEVVIAVGDSTEERGSHVQAMNERAPDSFWVLKETDNLNQAESHFRGCSTFLNLRDPDQLRSTIQEVTGGSLDVDLTSIPAHIWAPIIRACIEIGVQTRSIYIEPEDYARSSTPGVGSLFDLSERITGIQPIPGFAALRSIDDESSIFVPLMGFEGARLSYMLDQIEPSPDRVFPIIGVPGFKKEYPFSTYLGNQVPLEETRAWRNATYSRANCPFSAYYAIEKIAAQRPGHHLRIAPIGTKPHCLGAVLYNIDNQVASEIVYDHPRRSRSRTKGIARVSLFEISEFRRDFARV
ncbi:TPA: hypothetical protein ACKP8M_002033 [Stenotrophomonas maltophilia]|uniref:hypothetical protein n=1 Tax=uncultured Stenotrophomonas sp. TaxID=165438 RepID=UPI000AC72C7B|nr:hypothetical protein [uncultured Stenotrophomonas sp.]